MNEKPTSAAKLVWFLVFHFLILIAAIFVFLILPRHLDKTYQEFGIELPAAYRLIYGICLRLNVFLIPVLIGIQSFVVGIGLALILMSGQQARARIWNRVTIGAWILVLTLTLIVLMVPAIAIVQGLTAAK